MTFADLLASPSYVLHRCASPWQDLDCEPPWHFLYWVPHRLAPALRLLVDTRSLGEVLRFRTHPCPSGRDDERVALWMHATAPLECLDAIRERLEGGRTLHHALLDELDFGTP